MQVINWRGMFLLFETVTDSGPGNLLSGISWTYKKNSPSVHREIRRYLPPIDYLAFSYPTERKIKQSQFICLSEEIFIKFFELLF
jgi:hypothetical protein